MAQDASPIEMLGFAWLDRVRKADQWQAQSSSEIAQPFQHSSDAPSNRLRDRHAGLTSGSSDGSCSGKAAGRRDLSRSAERGNGHKG